jgi:hypothetical protein
MKNEAHVVAAVHGLHSIADIFAQAIYLSLNDVSEWKGYLTDLSKELPIEAEKIKIEIDEFTKATDFVYLDAIANQAKHRTITQPILMYSTANVNPPKYEFSTFKRNDKTNASRNINEFFLSELNRQVKLLETIGTKLNEFIKDGGKLVPSLKEKKSCFVLSDIARFDLSTLKRQYLTNEAAIEYALKVAVVSCEEQVLR